MARSPRLSMEWVDPLRVLLTALSIRVYMTNAFVKGSGGGVFCSPDGDRSTVW